MGSSVTVLAATRRRTEEDGGHWGGGSYWFRALGGSKRLVPKAGPQRHADMEGSQSQGGTGLKNRKGTYRQETWFRKPGDVFGNDDNQERPNQADHQNKYGLPCLPCIRCLEKCM